MESNSNFVMELSRNNSRLAGLISAVTNKSVEEIVSSCLTGSTNRESEKTK